MFLAGRLKQRYDSYKWEWPIKFMTQYQQGMEQYLNYFYQNYFFFYFGMYVIFHIFAITVT